MPTPKMHMIIKNNRAYLVRPKKRKHKVKTKKVARLRDTTPGHVRDYQLYALRLEDGYYYVGMTAYKDVMRRYVQHVDGPRGAKWTKLHKPVEVIETRQLGRCSQKTASNAENIMTREYMNKYGMYKVRGGDLCYTRDSLVALHFNDTGVKTVFYDTTGKKLSRSHSSIRKRERQQEQLQQHIVDDLRWIFD